MNRIKGIVGFFDILGYHAIAESDDESFRVAERVIKIFVSLPRMTVTRMGQMFSDYPVVPAIAAKIGHLTVSDSILIYLDMPVAEDKPDEQMLKFGVFLCYIRIFFRQMFEEGLPVRGSVNYGGLLVDDESHSFAGKAVVESYQAANQLDLSAVLLQPSFTREVESARSQAQFTYDTLKALAVRYLIPRNKQNPLEEYLMDICRNPSDGDAFSPIQGDLRQFILNAFCEHGKKVGEKEKSKVDNTERFFRFLKEKHGNAFG